MLQRDYIMKLIQQMIDSLFLLLNKKDIDEDQRKDQLNDFYKSYMRGTQDFFVNSTLDDIIQFLTEEYGTEELIYRVEMLTEIMYQDSMLEQDENLQKDKMRQTLAILNYLEDNSNTYSIVREGKIDELTDKLKQYE